MALGRVFGDALRNRFGPVTLVRYGSLMAAAGLTAALISGSPRWALAGFTLVGFGCSIVVPLAFTAAGAMGGGALAAVATAGYLGLFAGPPAIGFVAEAATLRGSLCLVVGLVLSGVWLSQLVQSAEIQQDPAREAPVTGSIRKRA